MRWPWSAKRRELELAERLRGYSVVLAGDEEHVLTTLREGARRNDVPVVEAGELMPVTAPTDAAAGGVTDAAGAAEGRVAVAVVAVRALEGRSALVRGLAAVEEIAAGLAPGSITVIVSVRGVARVAPARLLRLLASEILHQVESALHDSGTESTWRNARQRAGLAALTASGIDVLRVGSTDGGRRRRRRSTPGGAGRS